MSCEVSAGQRVLSGRNSIAAWFVGVGLCKAADFECAKPKLRGHL